MAERLFLINFGRHGCWHHVLFLWFLFNSWRAKLGGVRCQKICLFLSPGRLRTRIVLLFPWWSTHFVCKTKKKQFCWNFNNLIYFFYCLSKEIFMCIWLLEAKYFYQLEKISRGWKVAKRSVLNLQSSITICLVNDNWTNVVVLEFIWVCVIIYNRLISFQKQNMFFFFRFYYCIGSCLK